MLGLGTRLRSGRLKLGLRLGGPPPVVVPGATTANTRGDGTAQASAISGYGDFIGYLQTIAATKGLTIPTGAGQTVSANVDAIEAVIAAAEVTQPVPAIFKVATFGQSLTAGETTTFADTTTLATLGLTVSPNSRASVTLTGEKPISAAQASPPVLPGDGTIYPSSWWAVFPKLIEAALVDRPVHVYGHAQGATDVPDYLPGGALHAQTIAALERCGPAELCKLQWGHTAAGSGVTGAQMKANMRAFISMARPYLGSGCRFLIENFPNIIGDAYGTPAQRQVIRTALYELAQEDGHLHVCTLDAAGEDFVHPSQAGRIRKGNAQYRALRPTYGKPHDNGGPQYLRWEKAGRVITAIPTFRNGGTAMTGTNLGTLAARFCLFPQGQQTGRLPLDSVTFASDGRATVTLTTDPGYMPDCWFGHPTGDSAAMLYDNVVDDDGIAYGRHVQPNYYAVRAVAPGQASGPVFSISNAASATEGTDSPPSFSIANASSVSEGN